MQETLDGAAQAKLDSLAPAEILLQKYGELSRDLRSLESNLKRSESQVTELQALRLAMQIGKQNLCAELIKQGVHVRRLTAIGDGHGSGW